MFISLLFPKRKLDESDADLLFVVVDQVVKIRGGFLKIQVGFSFFSLFVDDSDDTTAAGDLVTVRD